MTRSETAALWSKRLERFAQSQMTIAEFCKSEGVSSASFYHWKKKQASSPIRQPTTPSKFVPVALTDASADPWRGAEVNIELPGGIRVRIDVPVATAQPDAAGARR